MSFDDIIDRRNTHCAKWDVMEPLYGVPLKDGIAMWVADMDFRAPDCVQDAVQKMRDHGIYGYFGDDAEYKAAIQWWMKNRHGWDVKAGDIFTTHGLVNGTALCVDAFTEKGDGVVLFTPVYHAFAKVINAAGRKVVECPLVNNDDRYEMDFAAYDAQMTGAEKMVILCSPHNPGGRVWTRDELQGVADFAKRHDLLLVSDEIHHDLIISDAEHTVMPLVDPSIADRLVMMTAVTKTFNIAGAHTGNVIIADPDLHAKFAATMHALGMSPNSFGLFMTTAAYSPEGAAWVDELTTYLAGNRDLFDTAINAIPGLKSMPLEATYLAWVDFSGT
ncbi:MAG TPA: aminotransferase class I/II-fold pyridoxal phosphate-dependent enzyme, partial [Rhodobacteraceae bacterium]|nr:aminotransferase class I/II-fold pyridoxal phosphate-dependent enzyme [Paracoccaceae bacterium]